MGERETSLRLKDKSNHTCVDQIATNADTIQVTGLMLDQLYEDDAKQGNIDHSAEVIEVKSRFKSFKRIYRIIILMQT